jgi:predicted nuclease of restriction endonuclease-like (RecB) superfamily
VSQKSLSRSHFVFLSQVKDSDERNFYLLEANAEQRSLRELKRQFNSALYERLALSKDKDGVMKLAQEGQLITTPDGAIKDPYVLEFLGLKEDHKYTENELEQAIIDNLEDFLLELGKGFTFVGRQKRFTAGEEHFYVDLVFYHRFLKCFILVDLKIGKITYKDIGQMQMYVNRYDKEYKSLEENKTIGLILCKVKDDIVLQYTLPDNQQIFTKEYKLYLPNKAELKQYLDQHLDIEDNLE